MEKIKNFLLYCSLSRQSYCDISERVSEENRRTVGIFSIVSAVAFIFVTLNIWIKDMSNPIALYLIPDLLFILMWVLNRVVYKKHPHFSDWLAVIFVIMLLGAGLAIGISQSTERTTLLLPFYILSSLLFCFRIIYLFIFLCGTEILYLIIASRLQSPELFNVNLVNTLIFCVIGVFIGSYMMVIKYKRHESDHINQFLLKMDPLTKVYNRRSYENELEEIAKRKKPVTICSFDINGLKLCNDTKGHKAGDELIVAAAGCIAKVFGRYGKVFRTGGDEFYAILTQPVSDTAALYDEFKETIKSFKGEMIDGVNVSCGIANLDTDYDTMLGETLQKADMLMYEDKKNYYMSNNMDRRKI